MNVIEIRVTRLRAFAHGGTSATVSMIKQERTLAHYLAIAGKARSVLMILIYQQDKRLCRNAKRRQKDRSKRRKPNTHGMSKAPSLR